MSTVSDAINATELIAILVGIYFLTKFVKGPATDFFQDAGAQVAGTADWVATATPLTPAHADSLAKFIGVDQHGGGWQLSSDGTQIWFFDGSYFDNRSGHFFDKNGNDQGDLLGARGTQASGTPMDGLDTVDLATLTGSLIL